MIIQLNPPLFFDSQSKGKVLAHFLIDYGIEANLMFVCFTQETGECWTLDTRDIRIENNITIGRDLRIPWVIKREKV
jgi:hypothetical protein